MLTKSEMVCVTLAVQCGFICLEIFRLLQMLPVTRYSPLGVYVGRGDINLAQFSYHLLAQVLHAVQFLALNMTAESLRLSSVRSIAFIWKKGSTYYKVLL